MTVAQRKKHDLEEENFKDRILNSLDPDFSKDLPFLELLFYINRNLPLAQLPFRFANNSHYRRNKDQRSVRKKKMIRASHITRRSWDFSTSIWVRKERVTMG